MVVPMIGDETTLALGGFELNRYDLYEIAVQCPPIEAAFLRALHGGEPRVLGEDFAGPAGISRAWLELDRSFGAVATDADAEPLRHAVRRQTERDAGALDRLTIRERDVLEVGDRADVIAGLNFAACEIHERARLVTYFRHVLYRLNANGVAVFDTYAGADALSPGVSEQEIETDSGVLRYIWQQVSADPTTWRVRNAIHFEVGGEVAGEAGAEVGAGVEAQRMDNAFVYDWRLWSVPELRDAMREAGFRSTEVHASYGEAMDESGGLMLGAPVSSDEAGAVTDAEAMPEGDESAVLYVVGRV